MMIHPTTSNNHNSNHQSQLYASNVFIIGACEVHPSSIHELISVKCLGNSTAAAAVLTIGTKEQTSSTSLTTATPATIFQQIILRKELIAFCWHCPETSTLPECFAIKYAEPLTLLQGRLVCNTTIGILNVSASKEINFLRGWAHSNIPHSTLSRLLGVMIGAGSSMNHESSTANANIISANNIIRNNSTSHGNNSSTNSTSVLTQSKKRVNKRSVAEMQMSSTATSALRTDNQLPIESEPFILLHRSRGVEAQKALNPVQWDVPMTARFISSIDPSFASQTYPELFEKNAIDGYRLLKLNNEVLQTMGIDVVGHRSKILLAIRLLGG